MFSKRNNDDIICILRDENKKLKRQVHHLQMSLDNIAQYKSEYEQLIEQVNELKDKYKKKLSAMEELETEYRKKLEQLVKNVGK